MKSWDDPSFINVDYQRPIKPRGVGLYQMFRGQHTKYLELNRRLMGGLAKTASTPRLSLDMTNLCP